MICHRSGSSNWFSLWLVIYLRKIAYLVRYIDNIISSSCCPLDRQLLLYRYDHRCYTTYQCAEMTSTLNSISLSPPLFYVALVQVVAELTDVKAELIRKSSEASQFKTGNGRLLDEIDSLKKKNVVDKKRLVEQHRDSLQRSLDEAKHRWQEVSGLHCNGVNDSWIIAVSKT